MMRTLSAVLLAVTALLGRADADERFIDGLRQRRLWNLAEKYCASRLAESALDPGLRVTLVVELARTYTDHALNSRPEQRDALWAKAIESLDQFRRDDPNAASLVLVEMQSALVHLARGELARREAELVADPASRLEEARRELRLAIQSLQACSASVAEQSRLRSMHRPAPTGAFEPAELASLSRNIDFQLARAFRNQALTYPPASADCISASQQAAELLDKLVHVDVGDTLTWQARVDEIACLRQAGDWDEVARRIQALEALKPPQEVQLAVRAEEIRLALDVNQLDAAVAIANRVGQDTTAVSPQLDAAVLDAYLAAWQQATKAGQTSTAEQWRQRAIATVKRIEQTHSPYWAYQAEALLASRIVASPATSDTAELVRAAESYYRVGKIDEALATYDKAIDRARANGRIDEVFAPAMAAAAIEQQQKRYAEAAKRLRSIALEQPRHEKAAAAHLSAIYNMAQQLSNAKPSELDEYVGMLDEHLRLWPGGPTADRARLWLGRLRERQRAWPDAVAAYGGISSDGEHTAEAIEGVSRCYKAWLESLKSRGEPTTQLATDAAMFFENVITGGAGLPTQWTPVQRQAGLDASRIWLEFTDSGAPRAQRILQSALAAPGETSSDWREAAGCWLALSLVAQGKNAEAAAMLDGVGRDAMSALSLLGGLKRAANDATPETRRQLAELSLRVAEQMQTQESLSPQQRRDATLYFARALADLGRSSEATTKLAALAAEAPKDADVQEAYADTLVEMRDTASVKSALDAYRAIEQHSKPGSERWFRAKYGIVLAHEKLGEHDRAVQIVRVTRLLHPDMGGREMKAKFDAVLRE